MKIAKACKTCRLLKRKCSPPNGSEPCSQCSRRGQNCSFTAPRTVRRYLAPSLASQSVATQTHSSSLLNGLRSEDCRDLICLYIRLIHNKPHTLFHSPTLLREYDDGSLPDQVLLGILAIAARFSDCAEVRSQSRHLSMRAKETLKRDIDNITLAYIQACVVIGNFCGAEGNHDAGSLYYGVAMRMAQMAQILHLPDPEPGDDLIAKEVRLRIFWSLYMVDRWSSAGSELPRQLPDENQSPLPMDEVEFDSLQEGDSDQKTPSRPGLWGHMVLLANIFAAVHDLHRRLATGTASNDEAEAEVHLIADRLDKFVEALPANVAPTTENLKHHASLGHGSAFVALHFGYHHYATLLYFPFLDLQLEQTEAQVLFAVRCRYHAAQFSDLLRLSQETEGCSAVYFIVAHMTVVSSSALLHTLLFGAESELPQTRQRLEANFAALVKLREYWPAVESLMTRLFTFQRACMWAADTNTHKVDRWMVGFLLDHALPVPEKIHHEICDSSMASSTRMRERGKAANDAMSILKQPSDTTRKLNIRGGR